MANVKELEEKLLEKMSLCLSAINRNSNAEQDRNEAEAVNNLANAYVHLRLFNEEREEN